MSFTCNMPGCETKKFSSVYNLNAHLKKHDRPQAFDCKFCPDRFQTRYRKSGLFERSCFLVSQDKTNPGVNFINMLTYPDFKCTNALSLNFYIINIFMLNFKTLSLIFYSVPRVNLLVQKLLIKWWWYWPLESKTYNLKVKQLCNYL